MTHRNASDISYPEIQQILDYTRLPKSEICSGLPQLLTYKWITQPLRCGRLQPDISLVVVYLLHAKCKHIRRKTLAYRYWPRMS
jgi:hypothetical protein